MTDYPRSQYGQIPGRPPVQDPRALPPQEVTHQAQGFTDWAEALSSGNPFAVAKAALKTLNDIKVTQDSQLELQRKVYERMRNPPPVHPAWIARGYRYDPAMGVDIINFGRASTHTHMYIQTVKTGAADGQFYLSLTRTMNIDPAVNRPQVEDFEFAGAVGGRSVMLNLPLGSQQVWYWSNIAHDAIIHLGTSKDALPGG
jgi:hypothetical protein